MMKIATKNLKKKLKINTKPQKRKKVIDISTFFAMIKETEAHLIYKNTSLNVQGAKRHRMSEH